MSLFPSEQQLEADEEQLRASVQQLNDAQRKRFYQRQSEQLKDPDTYAALNWFFLGGLHHCYLGRYRLFAAELLILAISIGLIASGHSLGWYLIALVAVAELPQLFFSQKIARQYNLRLSQQILHTLN